MLRSWRLGKIFGIQLFLHSTFLLLPAFVLVENWSDGIDQMLFVLALIAAVFGCVMLHELGHALMARRFGIPTRDITLYPIGGVASLERMSDRPSEELWIALAGPAVNVVIATLLAPLVILSFLAAGFASSEILEGLPDTTWGLIVHFLASLCLVNIVLVLFNMLPTFPMDGGRVLRALLTFPLGQLRATQIAVLVGRVLILGGFLLLACYAPDFFSRNPTLLIVGLFVLLMGHKELNAVRQREQWRQNIDTLRKQSEEASPGGFSSGPFVPQDAHFSGVTWDERTRTGIQWENGKPVGAFFVPR